MIAMAVALAWRSTSPEISLWMPIIDFDLAKIPTASTKVRQHDKF